MQVELEEKSIVDFLATKTDIANLKADIANLEIRLVKEITEKNSVVQVEQKKQFTSFITILVALFGIMVAIMLYMITKIG